MKWNVDSRSTTKYVVYIVRHSYFDILYQRINKNMCVSLLDLRSTKNIVYDRCSGTNVFSLLIKWNADWTRQSAIDLLFVISIELNSVVLQNQLSIVLVRLDSVKYWTTTFTTFPGRFFWTFDRMPRKFLPKDFRINRDLQSKVGPITHSPKFITIIIEPAFPSIYWFVFFFHRNVCSMSSKKLPWKYTVSFK